MIPAYCFFFITLGILLPYSHSLQSGYTCETSVTLTCPSTQKLVILEVIYSSVCPSVDDEVNGTALYAPSRCIGYYRERASTQCNGQNSCIIDNNLDQRPAFFVGQKANCDFKGQSINIEYSCVPDFYSSKLPRIDICSLQSLEDIKEGFIHTPNYPENYANNLACLKKVPEPEAGHRLKIYTVDFDVESGTVKRVMSTMNVNDWLEINTNGEKLFGTRSPYTLLFDDVIGASLNFKSDVANTKRSYRGFLLYFIVTSVRRSRPPKLSTAPGLNSLANEDSTLVFQEKTAALIKHNRRENNIGLVLLVILLSSILFTILCGLLLYKRRNDRRIRYLTSTFNSFISKRSKPMTFESSENSTESELNSKFHLSSSNTTEKLISKHISETFQNSDHIYSQDPLENRLQTNENDSPIYEYIPAEVIYQQIVKPNENIV